MRHFLPKLALTVLVTATIAACETPGSQQATTAGDTIDTMAGGMAAQGQANPAAIDSVRDAYQRAANAGDTDAIAALFTDDAVVVTPDGTFNGRGDIRRMLSDTSMEFSNLRIEKGDGPHISGDMAWETGSYTQDVKMRASGQTISMKGNYLVVLRRQADGSWKLVADADVPNQPAADSTRR